MVLPNGSTSKTTILMPLVYTGDDRAMASPVCGPRGAMAAVAAFARMDGKRAASSAALFA
jgi:hypothetical protein